MKTSEAIVRDYGIFLHDSKELALFLEDGKKNTLRGRATGLRNLAFSICLLSPEEVHSEDSEGRLVLDELTLAAAGYYSAWDSEDPDYPIEEHDRFAAAVHKVYEHFKPEERQAASSK